MKDRFAAAQQDEQMLSLADDIALIGARAGDVLTRVDTGESGALWKALKAAHSDLMAAYRVNDTVAQADALNLIGELIVKGYADYVAWNEAIALVEKRARLAHMQSKTLLEAGQMVSVTQAMVAMQSLVEAVREVLENDPDKTIKLARVQRAYVRLTGVPEREPAHGYAGD